MCLLLRSRNTCRGRILPRVISSRRVMLQKSRFRRFPMPEYPLLTKLIRKEEHSTQELLECRNYFYSNCEAWMDFRRSAGKRLFLCASAFVLAASLRAPAQTKKQPVDEEYTKK